MKRSPLRTAAGFGVACVAALGLSSGVALAATAGDLDSSFDGDGKLVLPSSIRPAKVLVQPDGKLVVADEGSFSLVRLNPDGSPDRGFDGDGIAGADFGPGAGIGSVALQPDGKIVVVGTTGLQTAVARFKPNGSLDPTFDPGGPDGDGRKVGGLAPWSADAIVLQPDGRIVIAGTTPTGMTASRLMPDGSPDGTSYAYADNVSRGESVYAATLAPTGALVVAGHSLDGTDKDAVVARFTGDGKLDKSLGGSGIVELGPDNRHDTAEAVFVQPDGKIVLAGDSGSAEKKMAVTRLNPDGTLDTAFGDGGVAAPDFLGQDFSVGAVLQADGKIVVAGGTIPGGEFAVARLDPTGTLDPSFGSGGKTTVAFDDISFAEAAALQPDGRLVVAGVTAAENRTVLRTALARVLADQEPPGGAPQPGAGPGGPVADTQAPVLTRLRVARRAAGRRPRIRFTLSEPARVRFKLTRRHRRTVRFSVHARAGANRIPSRRRTSAGRYTLTATPVDAAGNAGQRRRVRFTVPATAARR